MIIITGNKQLAKYASMPKGALPNLKALVVWDEKDLDTAMVAKCSVPVYLWSVSYIPYCFSSCWMRHEYAFFECFFNVLMIWIFYMLKNIMKCRSDVLYILKSWAWRQSLSDCLAITHIIWSPNQAFNYLSTVLYMFYSIGKTSWHWGKILQRRLSIPDCQLSYLATAPPWSTHQVEKAVISIMSSVSSYVLSSVLVSVLIF